MSRAPAWLALESGRDVKANALGVKIEAEYTVGEYDIIILSAEQSDGLQRWLDENGYRTPPGASRVLASYIRQNVRFFVAKVNLKEQSKLGFSYLRPLQVAFESAEVHASHPARNHQRQRSTRSRPLHAHAQRARRDHETTAR